jgi:hypothetical protein
MQHERRACQVNGQVCEALSLVQVLRAEYLESEKCSWKNSGGTLRIARTSPSPFPARPSVARGSNMSDHRMESHNSIIPHDHKACMMTAHLMQTGWP